MPIEEYYKRLKSRIEIAKFSGKSVEVVKQDFYAKVFMSSLTAVLAFPVHEKIENIQKKRKLDYKINWTQALGKIRDCGVILFFRENITELLNQLHLLFCKGLTAVRKGRSFERKRKNRKTKECFAYKPI